VKFTPEQGNISLDTHFIKEENGICTIQIEVTDTGIGISEEQQAKLFGSFQQAENSTSRKFGGTGLGLAISKRIVEMMDGEIWIESELGKGSTFAFTIKAERGVSESEMQSLPNLNSQKIRILAVDGATEVREHFTEIAERFGLACDVTDSGEEACALVRQGGSYNICFVDWNLPDMDGMEFSRRILNVYSDAPPYIVIMISSADLISLENETKGVGIDKFLQKPLFPSAIVDTINEYLDVDKLIAMEESSPEHAEHFAGYHLLLAEDVEINREIVLALLEPTQLDIDCAENGAEALKMYSESPDKYDMIFMDVQMPKMDGYEATRRIRAMDSPKAKEIPIVAMTANVFREDIENCIAAGMNDHVGKPLDLDEVLAKLHQYIRR
jgi:CheY-like chemotaxis protein